MQKYLRENWHRNMQESLFQDAAALHFDDDAFKILEPFAVSFNDLNVYANGVTDFELGKIGTKLLFFEFSDDV